MQKVVGGIPRGVGAPPPPGMDPRRGHGKLMCIKVRMLDDSVAVFHLGHKADGKALFDEVCRHLNLLECDYFGLEFIDGYGNRCWLEKDKSILRQITTAQSDARFYFICKFYTPNPTELEEEYTRYLLGLQIRRDLAHGELLCNENTAALLVSFIVQAECGDFSAEDYPDHTYLSVTNFVPNQTAAFQQKVMDNHKKLIGMGPAEADLALLETARRCDFYGIKLHAAKDIEGTDVALSVAHMGIKVFHQLNCISTFSWAKIRKLSFKRKRLIIKLHPDSYQYYKETIEFNFENRNECKNFWKKCVEHHAFFRCLESPNFDYSDSLPFCAGNALPDILAVAAPHPPKKDTRRLFSHGSSFRYQGRTQKQLIDFVREHRKRREPFQRPLRSNRNIADPYGANRDNSAMRRIKFNVLDPMLASTISAGSGGVNAGYMIYDGCNTLSSQTIKTTAANVPHNKCCAMSTVARPSPHYYSPHQNSHINACTTTANTMAGSEFSQRYSDVYYPQRAKSQQQPQPQIHNQIHQIPQQNAQYYYYNHIHSQQQQQHPQQFISSHYVQDKPHNHYQQPYNLCQQQQRKKQQLQPAFYGGDMRMSAHNSQRPQSVYATSSSAAIGTNTTYSDYRVSVIKNHHSSGDVPSICGETMTSASDQCSSMAIRQRAQRREDSIPSAVPEADEENVEVINQKRQLKRDSSYENNHQFQTTDPMSTSLPNVLTEDLKVLCQEYSENYRAVITDGNAFFSNPPPKSMSGDNFLKEIEPTGNRTRENGTKKPHHATNSQRGAVSEFVYDNMSEGSYRLGEGAGGNSSSTSDVGMDSLSARALSTTFTTKRVGNVIVKRVIDSNNPRKHSEKQVIRKNDDFENEESQSTYSESFSKVSSVSAPASSRCHIEQRPLRQRVVPTQSMNNYKPVSSHDGTQALINNDIYLKSYTIEQDLCNRTAVTTELNGRSILKTANQIAKDAIVKQEDLSSTKPAVSRPILIDGDDSNYSVCGDSTNTPLLTRSRAVLVTPISVRNPAAGTISSSSSTFSTPQLHLKNFSTSNTSQEHQVPILTSGHVTQTSGGKPIVQGAKYAKLTNTLVEEAEKSSEKNEKNIDIDSQHIKGIPGRIISKQNMVITPEGILPKEEITGQKREKPLVPPKPKNLSKNSPPVEENNRTNNLENEKNLLDPLNAVLAEQISASTAGDNNNNRKKYNTDSPLDAQVEQKAQKLFEEIRVSVQSEDEPDVRRLQTFGGAQIPYTLTMRNIETPKAEVSGDTFSLLSKGRRQKALDLISRKQLPSQNSFSSQDHSISPTSADSGNVVEYIMRRRSVSGDRGTQNDIKHARTQSATSSAVTTRRDRRQTQPISLNKEQKCNDDEIKTNNDSPLSAKPKALASNNNDKNDVCIAPKASIDEDLPEPPPPSVLSGQFADTSLEEEAQRLASKIVSGILETDF